MNVFLERTLQEEERKDKKRRPLSDIAQYFHWGLFCELSVLDQYSIFQILACKLDLRRSRFFLLDPLLEALAEDLHHLYLSAFSILINDIFPVPSFTKGKKEHFVSSLQTPNPGEQRGLRMPSLDVMRRLENSSAFPVWLTLS